jgi:hypothetical protein
LQKFQERALEENKSLKRGKGREGRKGRKEGKKKRRKEGKRLHIFKLILICNFFWMCTLKILMKLYNLGGFV